MQAMVAGSQTPPQTGGGRHEEGEGGMGGYAQGGTVIANRPTKAIFGEAGLEMATFTPLSRKGTDVNKIFSNLSGGGSGDGSGKVQIELLLSPDLESRIVKNTLTKTGQIVTKINRSKG